MIIEPQQFYNFALWVALNRGYKRSWAGVVCSEYIKERGLKRSDLPKSGVACEPTSEFKSWLTRHLANRNLDHILQVEKLTQTPVDKSLPKYITTNRGKEKLCMCCGKYSPASTQFFFANKNMKLQDECKKCVIKIRKSKSVHSQRIIGSYLDTRSSYRSKGAGAER